MNYKKLKITDLRDLCISNNISSEGKKDDLISRLSDLTIDSNAKLEFEKTDNPAPIGEIFSTDDKFFIKLKSSNLSHYLNYGVIYPLDLEENEIYKCENRKKDLFTIFPQQIILSQSIINSFDDDDILIEVIVDNLNIKESNNLEIKYVEDPIPISRIKKIHFKSDSELRIFISSIKTFPDSYIPEQLCTKISSDIKSKSIILETINLPRNHKLVDWKAILQNFDKVMGMLSFMKNGASFFADTDNFYEEYSSNYLNTLNLINSQVLSTTQTKDIGLYRSILYPKHIDSTTAQRVLFKHILDNIYRNTQFDLSLASVIIKQALQSDFISNEENVDLNSILRNLKKLELHQISFKDLLQLDVVKKNYPILVLLLLAKFPNKSRQHTDKQAVRNIFIFNEAKLTKSSVEFSLSVLGLYYGYKTMIKSDTNFKMADRVFDSIANVKQSIKFRLSSYLDRFTIESIFVFCKNNNTINETFSFLDFENVIADSINIPQKINSDNYYDQTYLLFKTKMTKVVRESNSDVLVRLINNNYSEIVDQKSLLVHYIISNFGITKSSLIELIQKNSSHIDKDEFKNIIKLDIDTRKN